MTLTDSFLINFSTTWALAILISLACFDAICEEADEGAGLSNDKGDAIWEETEDTSNDSEGLGMMISRILFSQQTG